MSEPCIKIRKRTNDASDKLDEGSNVDDTGSSKRPRKLFATNTEGCHKIIENIFAENVNSEIEIEYKGSESSSDLIGALFQHVDETNKLHEVFETIYNGTHDNTSNPDSSSTIVSCTKDALTASNNDEGVKDLEAERVLTAKSVDEQCKDLLAQLKDVEGYETEPWGAKVDVSQMPFYLNDVQTEEEGMNDLRNLLELSPVTEDVFLHDAKTESHNTTCVSSDVEDDISVISKQAEELINDNTFSILNCEGTEEIDLNGFDANDNAITTDYILDLVLTPTKDPNRIRDVEDDSGGETQCHLKKVDQIDSLKLEGTGLPGDFREFEDGNGLETQCHLKEVDQIDSLKLEDTSLPGYFREFEDGNGLETQCHLKEVDNTDSLKVEGSSLPGNFREVKDGNGPETQCHLKEVDQIDSLKLVGSSLPGDIRAVEQVNLMDLELKKNHTNDLLHPDEETEPAPEAPPLRSPKTTDSKLLNCRLRLRRVEEEYSGTNQNVTGSSSADEFSKASQADPDIKRLLLQKKLRDKFAVWKQQQNNKNTSTGTPTTTQAETETIISLAASHHNQSVSPPPLSNNTPDMSPQPSTSMYEKALPQTVSNQLLDDCNQCLTSSPMDTVFLNTTQPESVCQSDNICDNNSVTKISFDNTETQQNHNVTNTGELNSKILETNRCVTSSRVSKGRKRYDEEKTVKTTVPKKLTQSQQLIAQMKDEMTKSSPDIKIMSDLLDKTFAYRKKLLQNAAAVPAKILMSFPGLKIHSLLKEEFGRILEDVTKMQTLERKLAIQIDDALKLSPKKKRSGKVGKRHPLWIEASKRWEENPNCSVELKRILGMFKLCLHFAEEYVISNLCRIHKQDEVLDESTMDTPTIVLAEDKIFEENTSMWIYVDGEKFVEVPNFYEAVLCVYAVYYIFNIEYDKQLKSMFEFLDLLVNNPQTTYSMAEAAMFVR